MNETSKCPQCGKPVPDSAPGGLCPECMLKVGAAAPTEDVGPNGTVVIQPSPRTPMSVEEIAKYFPQLEILECMGRGGMGVVYKARHPKLDRFVALKILAPEKEGDPKFAERFEREARALARLNHPNIVAVHDFGESDGLFYLIMEFVDGTNLRRLIQERRIDPEAALAIVPSICEALQYAHGKGIVHRDIKPENVLLAKDGEVKIADFGIAKILRSEDGQPSLTEDGTLGTPHYMAPEQVETPKKVDHRADIYSLGVVFYEMLTGELPLGKFAPPSRKVQVDVRLDEVVLHALEKEPDRRYQQAGQIKSDVETISTSPLKSEGRNSKSEERASSSNPIEVARRQVSGPGIGLIICGILNWVCLPLSLLVVAKFFNHGGSPAWIAMSGLGILVGLLPLLLGGFMIYAGLMMRRLKHYPAAIIASVGAMLFTPGNLIGLPIGIWALVVLCGKDVRAAFRAVREGASLPSSPVQLEKAGGRSGIGWLTAGIVVLVLGVPLIALLFFGGLAGLYSFQAMRAPEVVRTVESSHPLFVAVQELSFGPIQQRVLHQRHDGTTNWFLDLETGNVLMPPPELAESLVRQELTSVPGTRAMQFADWVKRTGVDLAVYGPDAFAALGGTWKPTHGATYEDWDDLDAQTPAQLLTSIRAEARKPSWHGRQEIHGVGPRSVLFRDFSVNYFFRTRDGALGVLQVVGRDEASGGLKLRYRLAEASGSSVAPQPKAFESGRSFGLEREVILNDADASAEALDFETGRVLVVPEEARRQLLAANADWFVNSGVDLLTETTQKGVGLITVRTNALTLVKLASEEWHGLTPAQLTEALDRGMSGLPEAETHFTKVYLLHTKTPTPVTLGFRTGSGAEGVMQASWPAGEQHPAITLRYKLAGPRQAMQTAAAEGPQSAQYVGEWLWEEGGGSDDSLLLKLDPSGKATGIADGDPGQASEGEWFVVGDGLRIQLDRGTLVGAINPDGNLGLKNEERGDTAVLRKIQRIADHAAPAGTATAGLTPFLGIWQATVNGEQAGMRIDADGSCTLSDKSGDVICPSSLEGKNLIVRTSEEDTLTVSVSGPDTLRTQAGDDAPITFVRVSGTTVRQERPKGDKTAPQGRASASFGPVISHTLQDVDSSRTRSLLNLDSGRCVEAPETFPDEEEWNPARADQWLIENGVDLAVGREVGREKREGIYGFATSIAGAPVLIRVSQDLWNVAIPDAVRRELDSGRTSAWETTEKDRFYILHLDPEPSFPVTYAFRTQKGTAGLLQVTGFAPGKEGLQIRLRQIYSRDNRLEPIPGWAPAGSHPQDYEMGRDRTTTHAGKASALVRSIVPQPSGFGTLMQSFAADTYRDQRVRLSGFLQTVEVGDWAGLWMRVDGPDGTVLAFDNMQDRPVTGTTGWTLCEIVLDVPEESKLISIGLLLSGAGQVWMDDLKFEEVGNDVDTTGMGLKNIGGTMPQLNFED